MPKAHFIKSADVAKRHILLYTLHSHIPNKKLADTVTIFQINVSKLSFIVIPKSEAATLRSRYDIAHEKTQITASIRHSTILLLCL